MNDKVEELWCVRVTCDDQTGVVAEFTSALARDGWNILDAQQHTDQSSGRFFMRLEVHHASSGERALEETLMPAARRVNAEVEWVAQSRKPRVAILASKTTHCVVDLLERWRTGELPCEVVCIVANHEHIGVHASWYDVPFHHVPFHPSKSEAYAAIEGILSQHRVDLTVLAMFMQIMPAELVAQHEGRMLNIHHSFLPSFAGAKPYHQAHEKGVKLVGATCHYVTAELDQGPILEQEVVRVSHRDGPEELRRKGRVCEREALARGVKLHLEGRVFVHGQKTVVFP